MRKHYVFICLSLVLISLVFLMGIDGCRTEIIKKDLPEKSKMVSDSAISNEEYVIYSYLIDEDKTLNGESILIENKATFGSVKPESSLSDVITALRKSPNASNLSELITEFEVRNQESEEIADKFNIHCCSYQVGKLKGETNRSFNVIVRFSRVGIDEKAGLALVYFEKYSGPKSASGEYLILKKDGEKWIIQKYSLPNWVS